MAERTALAFCTLLALAGTGCGSAPQGAKKAVAPEVSAGLERLRAPFAVPQTIVTDHLEIELSANFFAEVGQPSVVPGSHDMTRSLTPERDEYVWTNRAGGAELPLRMLVGQKSFVVVKDAKLTVRSGNAPITYRARASGAVRVLEGKDVRSLSELRIEDGSVRSR